MMIKKEERGSECTKKQHIWVKNKKRHPNVWYILLTVKLLLNKFKGGFSCSILPQMCKQQNGKRLLFQKYWCKKIVLNPSS